MVSFLNRLIHTPLSRFVQAFRVCKMSSMKEESVKVCCSTGNRNNVGGCGNYVARGRVCQLPDNGPLAYVTDPSGETPSAKGAIVVIYDIFGLDVIQTRRFADSLSSGTNMRVIMPDVFRGKPWPVEKFPPRDGAEFMHWVETAGSWDVVSKDIKASQKYLVSKGLETSAPLGILGFCWGGKQAVCACSGNTYARSLGDCRIAAGVVLHGSFLDPKDANEVTVPILFMPSGSDPDIQPFKSILDKKPFGAQCGYRRFDSEIHGFAAARGDWSVEHTREAIMEALKLATEFFIRHVK